MARYVLTLTDLRVRDLSSINRPSYTVALAPVITDGNAEKGAANDGSHLVLEGVREHYPYTNLPKGGLPLASIEAPSGHIDVSLSIVVSNKDLRTTGERLGLILGLVDDIAPAGVDVPVKVAAAIAKALENVEDKTHVIFRQQFASDEMFGASDKAYEVKTDRAIIQYTISKAG